ncbi:hypothetical protein NM688_g2767 [Phlebia brevispora]|uniref:Uncharacterized protein n=1 Tax=Phlebia brevispora TaxID=194682 RepID=A0ACC1T7V2_9APHY|nr:hypothetical protein NM688_g2767 [Phlebia brevispora]
MVFAGTLTPPDDSDRGVFWRTARPGRRGKRVDSDTDEELIGPAPTNSRHARATLARKQPVARWRPSPASMTQAEIDVHKMPINEALRSVDRNWYGTFPSQPEAPNDTHSTKIFHSMFRDISVPMYGLLSAWCTAVLYGMKYAPAFIFRVSVLIPRSVVMTIIYMKILFTRGLKTTVNRVLFVVALVQFSLATAMVAVCLQEAIVGFIDSPIPTLYFVNQGSPLHLAQITLKTINTTIGDCVLAWRLYTVWNRNIFLTIPIVVTIFVSAASGFASIGILSKLTPGEQFFSITVERWSLASWGATISAEMSATLLIAWKLWYTYIGTIGAHRLQHLKTLSIMFVILESGAILSSMSVILLAFYLSKAVAGGVIIAITLVPTSIFVRLASTNKLEPSDRDLSSSQFQSWLRSQERHRRSVPTASGTVGRSVHEDPELYEMHEKNLSGIARTISADDQA